MYSKKNGIILHPCAKINLGLNVVSKRTDGYHNLETVFYPINLTDEIRISMASETRDNGCELEVKGIEIEGDINQNIVIKAYEALSKRFELPKVSIVLTKNIPTQAGLGGGSSDCAFMITGLNKMFELGMSIIEMRDIASTLGADCPFFIDPTPHYAEGIGDELSPLDINLSDYKFVIVKPELKISTKDAFRRIVPHSPEVCCRNIVMQPIETWRDNSFNDFEESIMPAYPEIGIIKNTLYKHGAIYASLSGSGSAVYGIFHSVPANIGLNFRKCSVFVI